MILSIIHLEANATHILDGMYEITTKANPIQPDATLMQLEGSMVEYRLNHLVIMIPC